MLISKEFLDRVYDISPGFELCRYKLNLPSTGGILTSPLFGYGESDAKYHYFYCRYDILDNKKGEIVLIPIKDYTLLSLECPDFFTTNTEEYKYMDKHNMFFVPNEVETVLTYEKFIRRYTKAGKKVGYSDLDLKIKYMQFNKKYFNGSLPYNIYLYWGKMGSSAGVFRYNISRLKKQPTYYNLAIGISKEYHQRFKEDSVEGTLLHEMLHVLLPEEAHSAIFKKYCTELTQKSGITVRVEALGMAIPKWVYECTKCGMAYVRAIRYGNLNKVGCGKCHSRLVEIPYKDYKKPVEE